MKDSKYFGLFIKYTIKNEFNILKINIFFSLEIVKKVDKGPPFVSSSLQTEGSKSYFSITWGLILQWFYDFSVIIGNPCWIHGVIELK